MPPIRVTDRESIWKQSRHTDQARSTVSRFLDILCDGERMNKREKGQAGEVRAAVCLEEKGYRILERNYRCGHGEVDLIASKDGWIVFVEVKYRKTDSMGLPQEAVNRRKQQRISRAALFYLTEHSLAENRIRFDVIAILGEKITHLEDAFEYQG